MGRFQRQLCPIGGEERLAFMEAEKEFELELPKHG